MLLFHNIFQSTRDSIDILNLFAQNLAINYKIRESSWPTEATKYFPRRMIRAKIADARRLMMLSYLRGFSIFTSVRCQCVVNNHEI